jgi:glucose/mannose transport system substrate-binding protein
MADLGALGGAWEAVSAPSAARKDAGLRQLVAEYQAPLTRYLARLGVARAELEDALQDVLIIAASKLPGVPPGSERAFLFGTALRVANNARRGVRRRDRTSASLSHVAHDLSPSVADLADELLGHTLLLDAVEQMPADVQPVFVLVEIEELPMASVAKRLGLPVGTVASRLRRARAHFDAWCARMRSTLEAAERAAHPGARDAGGDAGAPSGMEILSWWVQRGETDALRALLGVYERWHPHHISVASTAFDGNRRARAELSSRMVHGRPPDTFQVNGGNDLLSWVRRTAAGEQMSSIDFLFASEHWGRVFPADLLELVSDRGRPYAVPLNVHRTNSLFFNVRVLREAGLGPPSTLGELYAAARVLRERGVVPFAMGYRSPWTLTLLAFEAVLVGEAGTDYYRAFFAGKRSADDPELRSALVHVARLLDLANDDAAGLDWDGALDLVRSGRAAMTVMGDWAKGYLLNAGCRAGEDFGQAPSPGCARAFVFATDVFGLPKRAGHPADAIELLKVFGSREGQDAFNQLKGSIPARIDVDESSYDALARASMRDFRDGTRVPSLTSIVPAGFNRTLDAAMGAFARDRDPEVVIAAIRTNYCLLSMAARGSRGA